MPKDIINSQLEQQKAKETAQNKSDIVNAKFAEALKTQFADPKEKPTLDLIQQGRYPEALNQLRLRIDVEDKSEQDLDFGSEGYDEDGYDEKVNTASEKETYREKLVTLVAYLEEMNALENSKEQSVNTLIAEIRSDLKAVLGLQDGDLEEQVKAVYQKLISEKGLSPIVAAAVTKAPTKPVVKKEVTPAVEKPVGEVVKKEPDAPVVTTPVTPTFTEGDPVGTVTAPKKNTEVVNGTPTVVSKEIVPETQSRFTDGDPVTSVEVVKKEPDAPVVAPKKTDVVGAANGTTPAGEQPKEKTGTNSDKYEDQIGYLEMTDRKGNNFLSGKVRRDFKNFVAQSKLSMDDNISEGGRDNMRDFFKVVKQIDLKSAMNALLTDPTALNAKRTTDADGNVTETPLKESDIKNYWKQQEKKGVYAPDGGKLNVRELNMLVDFTRMMKPIYDKESNNLTPGEEAVMLILNTAKANVENGKREILGTSKGLAKVKEGIEKVLEKGEGLGEAMKGLLGDYNYDGNVKLEGKNADESMLNGSQLSKMYNEEKMKLRMGYPEATEIEDKDAPGGKRIKYSAEYAENAMIANIVDIIMSEALPKDGNQSAKLESYALARIGFTKENVKTEKQFLEKCKEYPTILLVLQRKLVAEGEQAPLLLERGMRYAQEVYEREIRVKKTVKPQEGPRRFSGAENIEKIISKIDINTQRDVEKRISEEYAAMLTTLAEQIKTGKTSDGKDIPKAMLPELEKSLKIMKEDKVAGENKKMLTVNVFGAAISQIEGSEGAGFAANLTSEQINAKLSNEKAGWINSINLTAGVFSPFADMKNLAIGTALTFAGSKTWNGADEKKDNLKNGGEHRLLYAAGVGAGLGLQNGKLLVGPSIGVGYEEQINAKSMSKKLDVETAKYLGAMAHATLASRGVDGYYRRDHVAGIIEQQAHIESEYASIINTALLGKGATSFSFESVQKNLAEKFPKTDKDTIYAAAQNIMSMIRPYKAVFDNKDNTDAAAKNAVIKAIARDYALMWRNMNMEKLDGKFSLTGVGGGVEFIAFVLPIPHAGLQFTKYKGLAYTEMQESLDRAHDILANARGVDDDNKLGASILDRLPQLNAIFNDGKKPAKEGEEPVADAEYFKKDADGNLIIDPAVIGKKGLNIHILPELKQFVKTGANGELIVPASMPMMLRSTYRAKKYQYDFIIGSVGTLKTEAVQKFDGFVGAPEKYEGAEITKDTIDKKLAANIDGQTIAKYLAITEVEKGKTGCVHFSLEKAKVIFGNNLKVSPNIGRIDKKLADGKTERVYDLPKNGFLRMQENEDKTGKKELLVDVIPSAKGLQFGYLYKKDVELVSTTVETTTSKTGDIKETYESMYKLVNEKIKDLFKKDAIEKNNEVTMNMRFGKGAASYLAFVRAMDQGSFDKALPAAKTLLTIAGLPKYDPSHDDMRWLNAKLCMTGQTRDKDINHIEGGEASVVSHAKKLAAKLGITDKNELIEQIITCKCESQADKDALINRIKKTPGYHNKGGTINTMGDAYRLHNMLLNLQDIADKRTNALKKHLTNEKGLSKEVPALMNMRQSSLEGVKSECLYHGKPLDNAIGMVFGYNNSAGAGIQEKFVGNPSIAEGKNGTNTYTEVGMTDGLKKYYLDNLLAKSPDVIDAIMDQNPNYKKELLAILKKESCKPLELRKAFIKELVKKDGIITADFGFAFYNECFNESLIMKDLKLTKETKPVEEPKKEEKPGKDVKLEEQTADVTILADNGFYLDNYATVSKATVKQRNYAILVAFGGKQAPKPGTPESEIPGEGISVPVEGPDGQNWTLNIKPDGSYTLLGNGVQYTVKLEGGVYNVYTLNGAPTTLQLVKNPTTGGFTLSNVTTGG